MGYIPENYVGVHTRVEKFHSKYPKGSIETNFETQGELVCFKATIYIDEDKKRCFNGSSIGTIKKEKAFEKLETVAVGRALAFAGFEVQEGIASSDEIQRFESNNAQDTTIYTMTVKDVENWNGKIYPGNTVYVNQEKKIISEDQVKKLEAHEKFKPLEPTSSKN